MKAIQGLIIVALFIGVVSGLICFQAWIVQLCWNLVMPKIFGLTTLTFIEALGVSTLLSMCKGIFYYNKKG